MVKDSVTRVKIKKLSPGTCKDADDWLAIEEPLEVQIQYGPTDRPFQKIISVTMRTPGHDEELAAGFLFTEGIIRNPKQVSSITVSPLEANKVLVALKENESPFLQNTERNFYTSSSCGVCGKASIDAIQTVSVYQTIADNINLKADLFHGLPALLRKEQAVFESTGGLHASALFDLDGNFILLREDVGRHNALDKVIGAAFLNEQLPLDNTILLLSGRASFELLQKATMAGIKIVAAIGAPSSLAVKLAKEAGITLVGFLRNDRFNIYSGHERITLA